MFNQKDARILKLLSKGMSVEQVARKIGTPGLEGRRRVIQAMDRARAEMETSKEPKEDQ